jgi:lipopolysaccharide biosynthesis glycosyltransferase
MAAVITSQDAADRHSCALVFVANDDYARGLAVAVYSTLTHLAPSVQPEVFVLEDRLTTSSSARLKRVLDTVRSRLSVTVLQVDREALSSVADATANHLSMYARMLIPDMLPRRIRRALYVDADVIVADDLSPLFAVDLHGAALGAVRDFAIATTAHPWSQLRSRMPARPYFNSGVLLIDLDVWRRTDLSDQVLRFAVGTGERRAVSDQDALNAVVAPWTELDYRWNVQVMNLFVVERLEPSDLTASLLKQRRHLCRDAAVWHFVGPNPWSPACTGPGVVDWWRTLIHSGYYDTAEAVAGVVPWFLAWVPHKSWWWTKRFVVRLVGRVFSAVASSVAPRC